jgi:TRAP-type C4-dicarboxylate transport system permease small subunit
LAAIDRALLLLARALLAVSAAACAAIFAIVLAAVVMRYAVAAPFRFTEELSGLLLAAMAFGALPWAMAGHANIRVTLVTERLPPLPKRIAWVVGQLILIAFCAVFVREAIAITEFTQRLGLKSEQSRLPLAPWLWWMVGSMALTGAIGAWWALRPPVADEAPRL